jgi:hypothetical protein
MNMLLPMFSLGLVFAAIVSLAPTGGEGGVRGRAQTQSLIVSYSETIVP